MKPQKIESIDQLLEFIDEYYDTEHKSTVLKAVEGYLNVKTMELFKESKEVFIQKVINHYDYIKTLPEDAEQPVFLTHNPSEEFNIKSLVKK